MGDFDRLAGPWRLVEAAGVAGEPLVRFWVNPDPGWGWVEVETEPDGNAATAGGVSGRGVADRGAVVGAAADELLARGNPGGPWRASPTGLMLASLTPRVERAWLTDAAGFVTEAAVHHPGCGVMVDRLVLQARDGTPTARLVRPPEAAEDPSIKGHGRVVVPLAPHLVAASEQELLGPWVSVSPVERGLPWQNVEFRADGWWWAFPKGNVRSGRWVAGPDGALLAIYPYAKTLAWSGLEEVDTWLTVAAHAGFDAGGVLVVFDDDGREVQRLRRFDGPLPAPHLDASQWSP